jgi:hypothetical protein
VRAALRAAAERLAALRLLAAERAWRDSDFREAALWPSRRSAFFVAADRFADRAPRFVAAACLRGLEVFFFDAPFRGISIPALRAFESPIAIA